MGEQKGLLWRAFDAAEKAAAPRLEGAVRTGTFAAALSIVTRVDAAVRHELEARSRRLWHGLNLPAGSDVTRLRRQIATLDRELRHISRTLEHTLAQPDPSQEADDADDAGASGRKRPASAQRTAGSSAPGRRAQRAPRP
ncbi:MAG: hypothetical protein H0V26_05690 [Solirubrobacterales bacterium]|nr:hypothetical protein [Solirubrobacterales bacterium]